MRRTPILSAALFASAILAAQAAGDHHHGPGPNGGRVADAGPWHAELVTREGAVAVYLSDGAGKPLPAAGFSGTAILIAHGKPARIPLAPDGARLAGRSEADLGDRPKGALRLTGPDGAAASARFE